MQFECGTKKIMNDLNGPTNRLINKLRKEKKIDRPNSVKEGKLVEKKFDELKNKIFKH